MNAEFNLPKTENLPFLEMGEGKIFPTNWKIISFTARIRKNCLLLS